MIGPRCMRASRALIFDLRRIYDILSIGNSIWIALSAEYSVSVLKIEMIVENDRTVKVHGVILGRLVRVEALMRPVRWAHEVSSSTVPSKFF